MIVEEPDLRYTIAESTLPDAGYGLFAKELLKKDDYLEVMGALVKKGGVADQCTHYAKRYKFASLNPEFKIVPMGYAGIVNHTDDPAKQNCELTAIRGKMRNPHSHQIVYRFTRDIQPGEELLGNYGEKVGVEVKKLATDTAYHRESMEEWNKFLKHNVYDLKRLCDLL